MGYSRIGLILAMSIYKGCGIIKLLESYIKNELGIEGEISTQDGLDLLDVRDKEEAEYAIKYIKRKYGRE